MKLNQFFTKPVTSTRKPTVFQLGNESREQELEAEIAKLKQQVTTIKTVSSDNRSLQSTLNNNRRELKSLQHDYNDIKDDSQQQEQTLQELTTVKIDYDNSLKEIATLEAQLEQAQSVIETAQTNSVQQQLILGKLTDDHTKLSNTYGNIQDEHARLMDETSVQKEQLVFVTEKFEQRDRANQEFVIKQEELVKTYSRALSQIDYWRGMAESFADQIDEFKVIEQKLNAWIQALTKQNEQESSKSRATNKRFDKTQQIIGEMNGAIEKMADEQAYLQETNRTLKAEVAKPKYLSMGAIQRLENFAMTPMGAALNRNKLYLGNGKPTLLKFKSRGTEKNDN